MSWWIKTKKQIKQIMENSATIVTMNSRNLEYVYPHNKRSDYPLADDKLKTKALLEPKGLAVPQTYAHYAYFYELDTLEALLEPLEGFVIKPSQGSGGNGIMVVISKADDHFITAGGKKVTLDEIKKHIGDIIFGVHSMGMNDVAILEERLLQHSVIERLSPDGLADIRIICYQERPTLAMMRIATKASDGKANLHQGGIGIAIDMEKGITTNAQIKRENITHHPDQDVCLLDLNVPHWEAVKKVATEVAQSVPLRYLGIDIALTTKGPVVLEINVRPGIEIQNINEKGMRPDLEQTS